MSLCDGCLWVLQGHLAAETQHCLAHEHPWLVLTVHRCHLWAVATVVWGCKSSQMAGQTVNTPLPSHRKTSPRKTPETN